MKHDHEKRFTFRMNPRTPYVAERYPQFIKELTKYVNTSEVVDSNAAYTAFLRGITNLVVKHKTELAQKTPMFDREIKPIGQNELTIATGWGGVSFREVSVRNDSIEKLLVARQATTPDGVLGFEYHHLKNERLTVLEGLAIFMLSDHASARYTAGQVILTLAHVGATVVIHPESEHGVIPLTNVVIEERSDNHLDRSDLLFIFQAQQ